MAAPFVIVGAGEAGVHAALALRDLGCDRDVLVLGAETHRPYERPPLSKFDAAANSVAGKPIGGPDALADLAFVGGTRVTEIRRAEKRVFTDTGAAIAYDRLLIATGAGPRRLAMALDTANGIRYLRTLEDAAAIRRGVRPGARIVVIGGGLIGMELAASARMCGAAVTVLEAQPSVLRRGLPAQIAAQLDARHRSEGVRITCGVSIAAIRHGQGEARVSLAGGETLEADMVIAGAGSVPDTQLADGCGLAVEDGILVDAAMRTGDPDIFAAGDCCRFPLALYGGRSVRLESWRSAQEQGRIAAAGMLGIAPDVAQVPWFWSDQYDLGLQAAGLFDMASDLVARESGSGSLLVFGLAADGTLVAAAGVAAGTAVARDIKLAEMLIARCARPDPASLADPSITLKSILAARP